MNSNKPTHKTLTSVKNTIQWLGKELIKDNGRWTVAGALAIVVTEIILGVLEVVPYYLLPTVLVLGLTLLLAAPPVFGLIPKKYRQSRRFLRFLWALCLVTVIVITVAVTQTNHHQDKRDAAKCLASMDKIGHGRSDLRRLGSALCREIASEHS